MRSVFQLSFIVFALLCFSAVSAAQSESLKLNVRLAELYQKGDLDAAIPLAEEIVGIERRATPGSDRNLTNALENLGQLKLDRVKRSMAELRDPKADQEKAKATFGLLRKDAGETEDHFREAIDLSARSNGDIEQAINLRSKLAWLNYNYIPADTNPKFGFDKDSRDKLELRQRAVYVRRFDESRKLYMEAREIAERGGNAAVSLRANFGLAEFESAMGNFEAALPLFEKLVADAERLLPRRSPELIAPYEAYLKILVATGQEDKAFDMLSKIVTVTGRSAEYPKALLNLTRRAERSFAPVNSILVEEDARKIKSQAELAGRSVVARTAAAGGNAPAAALGTSVDGRLFYETLAANGIRLQSVIVRIELDGSGRVQVAEANSTDRFLKETAEAAARSWAFRPFLVEGKPAKLKGYTEVSILSN